MIDGVCLMTDEELPDIAVADAVSIGFAATRIDGSPAVLSRAREALTQGGAILLPSALDSSFLRTILTICRKGPYAVEHIGRIGWGPLQEEDPAGRPPRFPPQ